MVAPNDLGSPKTFRNRILWYPFWVSNLLKHLFSTFGCRYFEHYRLMVAMNVFLTRYLPCSSGNVMSKTEPNLPFLSSFFCRCWLYEDLTDPRYLRDWVLWLSCCFCPHLQRIILFRHHQPICNEYSVTLNGSDRWSIAVIFALKNLWLRRSCAA